jgi:hypothetical protein
VHELQHEVKRRIRAGNIDQRLKPLAVDASKSGVLRFVEPGGDVERLGERID